MRSFVLALSILLFSWSAVDIAAYDFEPTNLMPSYQIGLTTQKSPTIFLHMWGSDLSGLFSIRFTLVDSRSMRPVAEVPLECQTYRGLQRVQLGAYGIELQPKVPYEWYVTEIFNQDPSQAFEVTRGSIVRIAPKQLSYHDGSCGTDTMWKLIDAKIWYDAFACVNDLIEAYPDDLTLHDLRDELLGKCRHPYDRMPLAPCFRRWW